MNEPAGSSGRDPVGAVARRLVAVHKSRLGKGPTRSRVFLGEEVLVVTLEEPFTPAERALLESGDRAAVQQHRAALHALLEDECREVVESELARPVSAVVSGIGVAPDVVVMTFLLHVLPPSGG